MTLGIAPDQWVALNADVVGYSALVADDVDATTVAMGETFRAVSAEVEAHGGTLANFVGDSFMAVFRDPMSALKAAREIAAGLDARNAALPERRRVRLRMGMDQGAVTFTDEKNHHGDALNIAARIQALAQPGGLAVSERVYRALDEPELRFRALGTRTLKNIPEPVGVYEFTDLPRDGAQPGRGAVALAAPIVAVVPMRLERVDDEVRALASMIRQDLLHRLSTVPGLTVVDAPSEPTGAGAGARYMLESGVHQFGEHVRVYVTLFDLTSMNVVKSHKWSVRVADLFGLSEGLVDEVARSVQVDLVVGEPARLYADLEDPGAIEEVYLGWFHLRSGTQEGWTRALDLFERVAARQPGHPFGHALTAFSLWYGAANQWALDPEAALERAAVLASTARSLGDSTGMAQATEAAVQMSRGDMEGALERVDSLDIVRPTCDLTYGLEGSIRRYLGQWDQAAELADRAMRLTGLNKPWYATVKACSLFLGGHLDEAAALAEGVLEHQPRNLEALLVLAGAQQQLGMDRRSRATGARIRGTWSPGAVSGWLNLNPYRESAVVARWKASLSATGAIDAADVSAPRSTEERAATNQRIRKIWDLQAAHWYDQRDAMLANSRPVHEWLIATADPRPGKRLLDVAAGPGDTGFLAAPLLEPGGRLLCTDLAPNMLDVARLRAAELGVHNVDFQVLDAQQMALDDGSVDGVVCRWGLMLMPEPAAAVRECRRVLRPGGTLAATVFASPEDNPWSAIPLRVLIAGEHLSAPPAGAPGLFALADPDRLARLATAAGFDAVRVESVSMVWRFPDEDAYWAFLVGVTALGDALRDLSEAVRAEVRVAVMQAVGGYWDEAGLALPARCLGLTGRR